VRPSAIPDPGIVNYRKQQKSVSQEQKEDQSSVIVAIVANYCTYFHAGPLFIDGLKQGFSNPSIVGQIQFQTFG
jgi:hypothetical protein